MDILLNERQKKILEDVKAFAGKKIAPQASVIDESKEFPKGLITELADKGYLAAVFPKKYGGLELDPITYGLLTEEIGKHCCNSRGLLTVQTSIVGETLLKFGTKEQIEKYMPKMAEGSLIGAFALTEPDIGTDAMNVKTQIKNSKAGFVINGSKKWISFAAIADFFMLVGKCDDKMAVLLVESKTKGVTVTPIKGLLGCRASHISEIEFRDVFVPESCLLGDMDVGLNKVVSFALDQGRYSIAWGGVGVAQGALEAMVNYSRKRTQFSQKIRSFQLIQGFISKAVSKIHAARSLCLHAGELRMNGSISAVIETSIAKYFSSKVAMEVAENCVQVHGGNGCCTDYPAERFFREAKILEIIEGTSQILEQVVSGYGVSRYRSFK